MQGQRHEKSQRDIRGFLGLIGYYKKLVRGYEKIVEPLTNLLKKNAFRWGTDTQRAFKALKSTMITLPVMVMRDFAKEFIVETDASGVGIGVVLMQEGRLIAFLSKAFSTRNQSKSVYEHELIAIVLAFQKWRHYLLKRHFKIRADQRILKFLIE